MNGQSFIKFYSRATTDRLTPAIL